MAHQKRDWQNLHHRATFVDVHTHPTVKASFFTPFPLLPSFRRANQRDPNDLPRAKGFRVFNPFKFRTAFPLLQAGGADVLLSAVVVPETEMLPAYLGDPGLARQILSLPWARRIGKKFVDPTYFESTLNMLHAIEKEIAEYNRFISNKNDRRRVEIVRSGDRLREITAQGADAPIALIHAVEGAHSLQGRHAGKSARRSWEYHQTGALDKAIKQEILDNLSRLFEAGIACMTVAHFYPNHLAAPCFPYPEFAINYLDILGDSEAERINHDLTLGLTPLGEEVIAAMLDMGMLVDVTHCTPAARAGIYAIADSTRQGHRVVATHVGAHAINPSPYNLQDWEIKKIADGGGLVGVILMPYWTQPHERRQGLDFLSLTIDHIIQKGGEDVIAIGSDLDGFTDPPDELAHYAQMPRLTQRLMSEYQSELAEKYSDELVVKILGQNALNVLLNGWGKS